MQKVSFSRVVSGGPSVATAFDSCRAAHLWWRAVLWLHGKPSEPAITDEVRRQIVADGFRFYAQLYRLLGGLFWLVGAALWFVGAYETQNQSNYWTGSFALAGSFLWFASGLGFCGACALRRQHPSGRLMLCAFMVCVIAFLSGLTVALSVVAQLQTGQNAILNLSAITLVWVLGLGSYLIEILYLVGETRLGTGAN